MFWVEIVVSAVLPCQDFTARQSLDILRILLRHGASRLRQAHQVAGRSREREHPAHLPGAPGGSCAARPAPKQHSSERLSQGNYGYYRNCGSVLLLGMQSLSAKHRALFGVSPSATLRQLVRCRSRICRCRSSGTRGGLVPSMRRVRRLVRAPKPAGHRMVGPRLTGVEPVIVRGST